MADDPIKRLEDHARRRTPPLDEGFADRLESHLRIEHAAMTPSRRLGRIPALLPRLGLLAMFTIAAIVGVLALQGSDPGLPVAVVEGQTPVAEALVPAAGADEADPVGAEATPTPTPTPTAGFQAGEPLATAVPTATPMTAAATPTTAVPPVDSATAPTPDVEPQSEPTVPPAVVTPTATAAPVAEPTPTAIVSPTATAAPATAVPLPTATAVVVPTPTVSPTPTVTPERADIEFLCRRRVVGDAVGVICEWRAPVADRPVVEYEVVRGRNGDEAVVVSRQRAGAALQYIDRDVEAGDTLAYLVRGLDADGRVVAASVREIVATTD